MTSLTLSAPPTLPTRSHLSIPTSSLLANGWVASTSTLSLGGGGAFEGNAALEGGRGCEGAGIGWVGRGTRGRGTRGLGREEELCTGTAASISLQKSRLH